VVTDADFCHRKPDGLSWEAASAISTAAMAVTDIVKTAKKSADGDLVGKKSLIVGASGPAGQLLTEVLSREGADVTVVGSGKGVIDTVRPSTRVLDYEVKPFSEQVEAHSYDLLFDCVGGDEVLSEGREALKKSGQFLTVAGPIGEANTDALSWGEFLLELNKVGTHMGEGLIFGPSYAFVAGLKPDWAEIDKYILEPGLSVNVGETIPLSELDKVREGVDSAMNHWNRDKIVLINDENFGSSGFGSGPELN